MLPHTLSLMSLIILFMETAAVKVFSGVILQPIPHVHVYQASVPLSYKMNFPTAQMTLLQADKVFPPKCLYADCSIANIIEQLYNSTNDIIKHEHLDYTLYTNKPQTLSTTQSNRSTRSIDAIGNFFHFCCGTATDGELHGLEFNEQHLTDHLNAFKSIVKEDHQDLIKVTAELNSFTKDISNQFHTAYLQLQNKMSSKLEADESLYNLIIGYTFHLYSDLYILTRRNFITSIKERCQQKLLPSNVIKPELLKKDLSQLQRNMDSTNQRIAVNIEDYHQFYHLPITTCKITEEDVTITLKVPFITKTSNFTLFKYIPTPLFWKNQSCWLPRDELR
ncbi:uncharacterized protein LOC120351885 [Nilaparvata lugens]|uniref:uncharacterized protein LOC120351885 n=1 Tax=Nilaparvata lugens TaxID=108931 RepID=UPI00193D145A|nr:uncharacterized protein LOC120351885 [Nilaparvata lugens]